MSILLLGVGLFVLFGCEAELVESEAVVDKQEAFEASSSRTLNVTIIGTVLDPVTDEPLEGAKVQVGNAITYTNVNGRWAVRIGNTGPGLLVRVTAEEHVDFIFPVSFGRIADNATLSWEMELPPLQPAIPFEPGTEITTSFEYLGVTYTATIPGDISDEEKEYTIGPGGTAVGQGISGLFSIVGVDFEDDREELFEEDFSDDENYILSSAVTLTYDPLAAALSGGVGSINSAALEADALAGAQAAAAEVQAAIDAAKAATQDGASTTESAAVFVATLYGIDVEEVEINNDGTITVENCIEGTLQPGTGDITDTEDIVKIGKDCEIGEAVPLIDEETGVPHQGTADGG